MKKSTFLMIPLAIAMYVMISGYGGDPNSDYPSGAPAGYTGSPGDAKNCTNCHGGSASTVAGMITSNIPAAGYTPGTSYTITVTVTGSNNKGFEVSPQNAAGALLGTLTAGTGNKLVGSGKYVTQSNDLSGTAVWSFGWTAPAAGTGSVTFYGAFTASKPVTKLSTLVVSENSVVPLSVTASANLSTINPGGSSQLNAMVSGGTGSYSFSWTSNPAGFTSTQQNPTVSPVATTQYTISVNDGSSTQTANTTVTVNANALTANATATPSVICAGQSAQLDAIAGGGSGTYTYSWTSVPAGFSSSIQNPIVSPAATTTYNVAVSDGIGTTSASAGVTVNQPATVNAGVDTTYCVTISSFQNAGIASNYASVQWTTSGDGTFDNQAMLNPVYTPGTGDKNAGFVNLYLTASPVAPCTGPVSDGRHILFDPCNGIPLNASNQPSVITYPNPSQGSFTILIQGLQNQQTTMKIYDIQGKQILRENISGIPTFSKDVDLSVYPKGIYTINIQTNQKVLIEKIILQ